MTEDLVGGRVVLRLCANLHGERLRALHELPEVSRWWQLPSPKWPADLDPDTVGYVVLLEGRVVGFVQWYAESDPMYRHAGLDLFLDPAVHGRGLGTEVVRLVCAHLVDDRGYHRLVIDPEADNAAAIACYTKVAFRPVGVMRQYSRDRYGQWHDGLLMDLLGAELVRG